MSIFTYEILDSNVNAVFSTVYNTIPTIGEYADYSVEIVSHTWSEKVFVTTASWNVWAIKHQCSPFVLTFYKQSIGGLTFKFMKEKDDNDIFAKWHNGVVAAYLLNPADVRYTVGLELKITGTYLSNGKQKKLPYGKKFIEPWYAISKNITVLGTDGKPLEVEDTVEALGGKGTPMKQ